MYNTLDFETTSVLYILMRKDTFYTYKAASVVHFSGCVCKMLKILSLRPDF